MVPDWNTIRDSAELAKRRTLAVNQLSGWICSNYRYKDPLTHLKLQKLFFYCYGALLASDFENEVGPGLIFEPWDHGPVNRDLYRMFRTKGAAPITAEDCPTVPQYSAHTSSVLADALTVYGAMGAWSLRNQTHLELPWKEAFEKKDQQIDPAALKNYFKMKWASGPVAAPEYLFGLSSFKIDGIPVQNYSSLNALAKAVERVFSSSLKYAR